MRNILIVCGSILVLAAGYFFWSRAKAQHFGAPFAGAPAVAVEDLLAHPEEHVKHTVTIEGTVQKQCPVSGCYFYFSAGAKELKIELGDSLPTLPNEAGKSARVEGQLVELGGTHVFVGTSVEFGGASTHAVRIPPTKPSEPAKTATQPTMSADKSGYPLDICVVSGEKLGDMGEPFEYTYQGRMVKFCCKACQKDFDADPAKYMKKLDAAAPKSVVH